MGEREEIFVGKMMPALDEKQRRLFLSSMSDYLGYGSAKELSELTGVSEHTISKGKKEFADVVIDPRARPRNSDTGRVRAEGGGRKSVLEKYEGLQKYLEGILSHDTAGNPMNHLLWTTYSAMKLSEMCKSAGYPVSDVTIIKILNQMGFSLQQNKKYTESGDSGPCRPFQFTVIDLLTDRFIRDGNPVISVDTKKKEILGDYKNNGSEYREKGKPRLVNDHDFIGEEGKAIPYGIYDIGKNKGFVNVGISADTAEFAVHSISEWWNRVGKNTYPDARRIMITADCGGSNGRRCRLWKKELQEFADRNDLEVYVCHFPPGTSKWNKIEHRMFSQISISWRGQPLTDLQTVVNLIGSVKTAKGLTIDCIEDRNDYSTGIKLPKNYADELNMTVFNGTPGWNYKLTPRGL